MKKCYECGKELKFWEGYYHPVLGKKELVCSTCFDIVDESMEKYCNFILSEFKQDEQERNVINSNIKLRFFNWWDNFKKSMH
jgi:hypothetical protein